MNKDIMEKKYIGDGVYIQFCEQGETVIPSFVLTTENGITATNRIVLEPDVTVEMLKYIEETRRNNYNKAVAREREEGKNIL